MLLPQFVAWFCTWSLQASTWCRQCVEWWRKCSVANCIASGLGGHGEWLPEGLTVDSPQDTDALWYWRCPRPQRRVQSHHFPPQCWHWSYKAMQLFHVIYWFIITACWCVCVCVCRDPQLVKRIGAATALEVRATGIPYVFAPCVAVARLTTPFTSSTVAVLVVISFLPQFCYTKGL